MSEDKIFGHSWREIQARQQGASAQRVDTSALGDHGSDPLGDGMFRMVPSGDIVDQDERCRRLGISYD